MKRFSFILAPLLAVSFAQAQDTPSGIADADKEKYISVLETIKKSASSGKRKMIEAGIAAITPVTQNGNEAMKLFEKCYKKVNYDDNAGSSDKDWREWRTANKEELASPINKRAITYQARWALICMKAAMDEQDQEELDVEPYIPQVASLLTDVLKDSEFIAQSSAPFNGSVMSGAIGQVYRLDGLKPNDWPDSVMNIPGIIDTLILKKARETGDIDALRSGWDVTIKFSRKAIEEMQVAAKKEARAAVREGGDRRMMGMARMIDMIAKEDIDSTIQMMEFAKEAECFMCGDEVRASANMFKLLQNLKNPERREMLIQAMKAMIQREKPEDGDPNVNRFGRRMRRQPQGGEQQPPRETPKPKAPPAP